MKWLWRLLKSAQHHEHIWRWIVFPFVRQCVRCGLIEGDKSELSDSFKDYVDYLQKYSETRMFPKSAATGYHTYLEGCCPLPKEDPIHDETIVKQIKPEPKKGF